MIASSPTRARLFESGAIAVYLFGWILGGRYFWLALLAFALAGGLFVAAFMRGENEKQGMLGAALVSAAFVIPALVVLWQSKADLLEIERFRAYLAEHRCEYAGETVVGMSRGGCKFEDCVGPEPIEDEQFLCATTGKYITLTGFKEGNYGR